MEIQADPLRWRVFEGRVRRCLVPRFHDMTDSVVQDGLSDQSVSQLQPDPVFTDVSDRHGFNLPVHVRNGNSGDGTHDVSQLLALVLLTGRLTYLADSNARMFWFILAANIRCISLLKISG